MQFRIVEMEFNMNKFARIRPSVKAGLLALSTVGASAMAAVPADVTTALTDMKADALTVAGVVLVAIIAVAALKFIRKGL